MMEAAEEPKTTTTTSVTLNVGYPTSWQGVLKIAKCMFLLACIICSALLISNVLNFEKFIRVIHSTPALDYYLAVSVIGFVFELVILVLHAAGINQRWSTTSSCGILMLIYHMVMLILMFAACILINGNYSSAARAYNAFGILTIMGFSLEIYFNIVWVRGGPELAALTIPGQ